MAYNVTISETVNDVVVDSPGYPITINYNATVIETTGNVANLQAEIDAVEATVVILQGNVTTLTAAVANNTANITTLQGNVTTIQADVANNTANITTVQGNVTTIQADVANNTANITTLQGNVTTIQADVANNTANIATNTSRIANIEANVTQSTGVITTGNLSAGNAAVSGTITTGNILTDGYYYANGAPFTGAGGYGNSEVAAFLAAFGSNTISTTGAVSTGNVTAGNITTAGTGNIDNIVTDAVQFDLTAAEAVAEGELAWNSSDGTLDLGMGGGVTQQIGQDTYYQVRNATGVTLARGTSVYCSGVTGGSGRMEASPFVADGSEPPRRYLGLIAESTADGVNGLVTNFGYLDGLDTRGTANTAISVGDENWSEGDTLWAHPTAAGKLTNVEPTAPAAKICVAAVITRNQTQGRLFVRPTTNFLLSDLSDAEVTSPQMGEYLVWAGNRWENLALDISADTTPTLGGNLSGAGYTISNVASVTATGNVTANNVSATRFVNVGTASDPGIVNVYDVGSVRLWDNNNTNYVGISAPGDVSTNYTVSLPAAQGAANTVPVNDGSGALTWQAQYGDSDVATLLAAFGSNSIATTGNITGDYILGNGSQLTGLPAGYTDSDVANLLAAFGSNSIATTGNVDMGNTAVTGNVAANIFLGTSGNVRFDPTQSIQGLAEFGACASPSLASLDPGTVSFGNLSQPTGTFSAFDYNNLLNAYVVIDKDNTPSTRQGGLNIQSTLDYDGYTGSATGGYRAIQMQTHIAGNGAALNNDLRNWSVAFNGTTTVGQLNNGTTSAGNIAASGMLGMTFGTLCDSVTPGQLNRANSMVGVVSTASIGSDPSDGSPWGDVVVGNAVGYLAGVGISETSNAQGNTTFGNYYGYAMFRASSAYLPGSFDFFSSLALNGAPTYGNLYFMFNDDERFASYTAGNVTLGNSIANTQVQINQGDIEATGNVSMGNSAVTGTVSANVFLGTSGNVRFDPMQALQGLAVYGACTAPTTTATRDPGVIMVGNTAQLPVSGALQSDYNNQFNIYVSVDKQATPNVRQGGFNVQSTIDYGNGALTLANDSFRAIQMQNFVTGNGAVVSSTSGLPWPIAFNGITTVGQKSNGFTNVSAGNITVPGLFGMTSGLAVQQSTPGVLSQANSLVNMSSTVAAGSSGGASNPRGDVVIGNSVSYLASFAPRQTANATGTTTCGDYYGYAMFRSGSTVFPGGGVSALDISGSPTYGNLWFVYNNDERFASYMAGNVTMGNSIANTQVQINQGNIEMTGTLEIGTAIAFSGNVAATATDVTISHKIPVVINGVTYYIALTAAQ